MPDASLLLDPRERLIVALDFPRAESALRLVERLDGQCRWFKVGLELFLAEGESIVLELKRNGFQVFLDLKLHDIPNTVASAVRSVSTCGASLLTVHAAGGATMLAAAAEAAAGLPDAPTLLAVTVLTSMDGRELAGVGVDVPVAEQVMRLGRLALAAGIPGLVCSSEELGRLRTELGARPLLVVPGIRSAGSALGDQSRVATAAAAIAGGASKLVVGRPITRAEHPAAVFEAMLAEIAGAGLVHTKAEANSSSAL